MHEMNALSDQVRQIAYDIHLYHAHGHLEKVYENALAHRLGKAGVEVKQQCPIHVHDAGLTRNHVKSFNHKERKGRSTKYAKDKALCSL